MIPVVRSVVATTFVALLAAGCSSAETPSAEQQVCDARSQVQSSVDQVKQDLKDGNFGQAKDDLAQVTSDIESLVTAEKGLAQDKRAEIEPLVADLQSTLGTLSDASSLATLGATLDTALGQLSDVLTTISTTANCS